MNIQKKRPYIPLEVRKEQGFFKLAEEFRKSEDPKALKLLGEKLGRMVFGE